MDSLKVTQRVGLRREKPMRVMSGTHLVTFELCRTGRIFKGEESLGSFSPNLLDIYPPDGCLNFVRIHVGFCIWVLCSGLECLVKEIANSWQLLEGIL